MKYIAFFVMTLLVCLYSAYPAFALSDADYKKFMKESTRFALTDKKLSATWKLIKNANGGQIPSALMAEQKRWIQVERDSEAKALFGKMTPADAYANVTNKRIEKLTSIWLRENTTQAASVQANSGQRGSELQVGKEYTFQGQLGEYDGVWFIKDNRFEKRVGLIGITDVKFASMNIADCVSDAFGEQAPSYSVKVTAKIEEINDSWIFLDYSSATCKKVK